MHASMSSVVRVRIVHIWPLGSDSPVSCLVHHPAGLLITILHCMTQAVAKVRWGLATTVGLG